MVNGKSAGLGDYNFVTNAKQIVSFLGGTGESIGIGLSVYVGYRVYDSAMEEAKTINRTGEGAHGCAEGATICSPCMLMRKLIRFRSTIPYKEVSRDYYHSGLQVPDDVTLIWYDDNYGYDPPFPNRAGEPARWSCMYYHTSYWGRPHRLFWRLATTPELIHAEMQRAYRHGV